MFIAIMQLASKCPFLYEAELRRYDQYYYYLYCSDRGSNPAGHH